MILFLIILFFITWYIEALFDLKLYKYFFPKYYDDEDNNLGLNKLTYKDLNLSEDIMKDVERGYDIAKNESLVICGLARNVEKTIEKAKKKLEYIGSKFKDYKIVIFENDSEDNTREILKKWANVNKNVKLLECEEFGSKNCKLRTKKGYDLGMFSENRIQRMAIYREQYLDYIKKNLNSYTYTLISELDLEGNQYIDGIFHSIGHPKDWDAIFINGRAPIQGIPSIFDIMYDALAYLDISQEFQDMDKSVIATSITKNLFNSNYKLFNSEELVEVKSAFNGYALYKTDSLVNCSYLGDTECEHINLHKCMYNNGGKLYINPLWKGYFNIQGPQGPIEFIKSLITS